MSVNRVLFPLTVSEWSKSVAYQTDVITGRNGQEVRNAIWQDPLHKFNATFSIRTYADIQTLTTFFHAMRGREQAFLVKDWADYSISSWTAPIETGAARTTFQLVKRYPQSFISGSSEYIRTIKYPRTTTPSVTVQKSGAAYSGTVSVNATTGVITLSTSELPSVITFQCSEFYVPVRFDTDELPLEMLNYWVAAGADKSNVQIPDIPLVEVR